MTLAKYFWDLNQKALQETRKILKDPAHPKFTLRLVALLSRCDKPKELFSLVSEREFIKAWPKARAYWLNIGQQADFKDWWETIYEQLLQKYKFKGKAPKGKSLPLFLKIGRMIREARVNKGLSQSALAMLTGMKQPDISMVEEGKKNMTIATLVRICEVLDIKEIDLLGKC